MYVSLVLLCHLEYKVLQYDSIVDGRNNGERLLVSLYLYYALSVLVSTILLIFLCF